MPKNHHNCVWMHLRSEDELAILYKILHAFNVNLKVYDIVYKKTSTMEYHPIAYLRPPEFTDDMPLRRPIAMRKWDRIKRVMALARKFDQDKFNEELEKNVRYQQFEDERNEHYRKIYSKTFD